MPVRLEKQKHQNKFYGITIPASILSIKELSSNDKIVLAYIFSLAKSEKHFWGSNAYIQRILNISKATASKSIQKLIKQEYVKLLSYDGRTRILIATQKLKDLKTSYKKWD